MTNRWASLARIGVARLGAACGVLAAAACVVLAAPLDAGADERRFADADIAAVFPSQPGMRVSAASGAPPAAEATLGGQPIGYIFSTQDVVGSLGYSGKPIDILLGLDARGIVTGAKLIAHQEPILIIGVAPERLAAYVDGFAGLDLRATAEVQAAQTPEVVSGASVSSAVIRDAIIRAGRTVANARGLLGQPKSDRRLDRSSFAAASWPELVAMGTIARLRIDQGAYETAFDLDRVAAPGLSEPPPADALYMEMFATLATPPQIGQNLLGHLLYNEIVAGMAADDNLILLAANGRYSFKGVRYRKSGMFDRIQLVQGSKTVRLMRQGYRNVEKLAADGAPEFREVGLFVIPADTGFDPLQPWRIDLFVNRRTETGGEISAPFPLRYDLPPSLIAGGAPDAGAADVTAAEAPQEPLWQTIWRDSAVEIGFLLFYLAVLAGLLVFQDAVTRRGKFYTYVRLGFLSVTLIWLGWFAGAQLSVVNILTFVHALLSGFQWELFLVDPMTFILWSFVAVALLFWGRGVYCGWLCPFGALQELTNKAARWLGVPQISVPFNLHERLWAIKYIVFLGLLAASLGSIEIAFKGAEVEPFKTAISLKFVRSWPFVLYALVLLGIGLTIQRFYCRYLCPLGAALAIPARIRMFEWLKRRHQCGRECRVCAVHCTVQAIHRDGHINPNECIYCLLCQKNYYDENVCLTLIARARRRRRPPAATPKPAAQPAPAPATRPT